MVKVNLIESHSPNMRWGQQVFEVVLKEWGYEKTFTVRVGGNMRGFAVMEAVFDQISSEIRSSVGDDGPLRLTLTDRAGQTLDTEDEDHQDDEDWLKSMCVSVRLVGWEPPSLNEVRARHGAEPIPDGDVAWNPDGVTRPPQGVGGHDVGA